GRDSRRVNEGLGSFRTRIIEPLPGRFVGAVDVEAEVKIPADRKLDSVEFYWNGELAATVFDPPYRQRIRLPLEPEEGFLTAIARLSDGRSAEDVVVLNGQGRAERIDVELVELFTVVTDAARSPVRGLDATDFRVFEDGGEQALASFQEGAQAPLALGLLIDTSASMLPVLREVQGAAIDFALLTLRPQDRALVVGFGAEPRLLQPLSDDRNALVETIRNLAGGGWSPLTDSIVFAVAQMQQVPGRRALVLITDGVGREEGVSFATCQRFVEKGGIPLYVILLAGDDPTVRRAGGRSDERLAELVARVGGRIFSVDDASELGEVYRTIREELGSQYLLTYQPPRRADDAWRSVAVEVAGEGLEARTIRGYYP
ncbi:MAG TPA: VWA domain-containing protein, partial [Thermoanaerobaculia bacterium]|nr:VWA domain-containing protein [Thermoanaerobaculia bacterium]